MFHSSSSSARFATPQQPSKLKESQLNSTASKDEDQEAQRVKVKDLEHQVDQLTTDLEEARRRVKQLSVYDGKVELLLRENS